MRATNKTTKKRRHKKFLKAAKGYRGAGSKRYKTAKNLVEKGMVYSTIDRKNKKRTMRALWIARINAACQMNGVSYSDFIAGLKKADILIDRHVLQEIANSDSEAFSKIVEAATNN
ncbi:MAG: 50S ribosomal protein L20 [Elusimicrobia bacterium]|nr:50S ribosomal protein L20 [Elusimicrobiota bacterium]